MASSISMMSRTTAARMRTMSQATRVRVSRVHACAAIRVPKATTARMNPNRLPSLSLSSAGLIPLPFKHTVASATSTPGRGSLKTRAADEAPVPAPAKPAPKPRLPGLDSVRFFLIAYIATGHFIACATRNPTILALATQINVVVGAFFVLSGYVAGYVATELGKREASPRTENKSQYIIGRIMGYYPLFFIVQVIFAPMFMFVDNLYSGPMVAGWHAFLSTFLLQAWFPMHAEIWNAPTWFLSALTFAMVVLAYAIGPIAKMCKSSLKKCIAILTGTSLVAKLAYSYDLGVWSIMEGVARSHPSMPFWNITRFSPFFAVIEVLIGVAACRLVMLDGVDGDKENEKKPASPLVPVVAMVALLVARGLGYIPLNDPLVRVLIFLPLFVLFLMRTHRETVYAPGTGLSAVLAWKPLVYLGTISFPIYVLHGPLGQLFYKKAVATKVFGKVFTAYPKFFFAWVAIVMAASVFTHEVILKNAKVQEISKSATKKLMEWAA
eukprot:CAMPEP_0118935620 /NCGR_PEP_ID=MMETSP1169-20130426/15743_1 /TAXON_ID=36882 /ORGANISM="Pyramimonas obovata, Strain CCMP722" /LENGTH=495 /DNA_ID=CAMNT_0006878677 /DNA_START=48 /DNA_END=1535 /DNA_ORIENTATION=+